MSYIFLAYLHSLGISHKKLADIDPAQSERLYHELSDHNLRLLGIKEDQRIKILAKKTVFSGEKIAQKITSLGVKIIHRNDPEFPSLLKNIPDAPTILYVRGVLPMSESVIAIIGSRKHSTYAHSSLEKIIPDLVRARYSVVSGGAYGIDAIAHDITIKNGGHTVVVFGCGIDVSYPSSHTALFEKVISSGGALISHFPMGTLSEPYNFPIRNTIVAGMTRGTLIAEAGKESGTLITARLALEYNRDVFVIPADISREGAAGSNALIRDGLGKLIMNAEDILCEYQIMDHQTSLLTSLRPAFSDPHQEKIYEILCQDTVAIDDLIVSTELDMSTLMTALSMMEIEGIITSSGGLYRVC